MTNSNKKINFSKEIDNSISSYSLVITFIILGLLLQFYPSSFGSVSNLVTIIFIVVGILGFLTEIGKTFEKYNLKGSNGILTGVFLILVLLIGKAFIKIPNNWFIIIVTLLKIMYIFFLLVGIYSLIDGIFLATYSIYLKIKDEKSKKRFIKISTELIIKGLGLILVILQIIEVIGEI